MHNGAYITHTSPPMIESRPPSVFVNSAAPRLFTKKRATGAERNGMERNGRRSYHLARRYQACTRSRSSRWWGSPCRAGGVQKKKRELVGLVTRRARERSGSVRVHSPNSASGCDRSYLTLLRSRHAESRQSLRFARDRAIRSIARRSPFLYRRPDLFAALGST